MSHTFHIPVLGLAFSIDTPVKVARYGISSVVSIVDDILIERMRQFYTEKSGEDFIPIPSQVLDFRAKRITAYLNLLKSIVDKQFDLLSKSAFIQGSEVSKYFELLPERSPVKKLYCEMLQVSDVETKMDMQKELRKHLKCGSIDVNIMSKVDKINYSKSGDNLGEQFTDAIAALRGFAQSELNSSLILSAGMNPRLYSSLEDFADFYPTKEGSFKKQIILKVSDFRSAFIQAKFLAKKGLWISEFRIESGLNCGGHAFATEGYLLGPILEEFKQKRQEMVDTLFEIYQTALEIKGINAERPAQKLTVQGGIGTAEENNFLVDHYKLDGTGWGSPFLLVPEATNVDEQTLEALVCATQDDFYISGSSPLGIPFNNFRKSSAENLRLERIKKGRPGSPCKKKFLVSNTEFTEQPICTASREFQNLKIKQLESADLPTEQFQKQFDLITEKVCLCEGLATSAYIKNNILEPKERTAVSICPGPNLAYFSGSYTLEQMIKHIYGKVNLLNEIDRPNLFINELKLYIEYLDKEVSQQVEQLNEKKQKYLSKFKEQLQTGISYYKELIPKLYNETEVYRIKMLKELLGFEGKLKDTNFY
jgi:hypothetical protein